MNLFVNIRNFMCIMVMDKYFVYRHVRLDTNEVFYIGVGTKYIDKRRADSNPYRRAFLTACRNSFWKNIVAKTKYEVHIIYEADSYEIIEEKEKEFIKLYGRKDLKLGSLCNLTDGGKGQKNVHFKKHSDETKKKMSDAAKGRKFTEEHKEKLRIAKLANPVRYWKDKKFSDEHKTNLSKPKIRK